MEKWQMESIQKLRHDNYSYRFIGEALGIPPNTVKSVCRRNRFETTGNRKTKAEKETSYVCKNCGALLTARGRQGRRFCSDTCRQKWWRKHQKQTLTALKGGQTEGGDAYEDNRDSAKAKNTKETAGSCLCKGVLR